MRSVFLWLGLVVLVLGAFGFVFMGGKPVAKPEQSTAPEPVVRPATAIAPAEPESGLATATFGNGCFWCTEAVFQQLKGVRSVASGYTGGSVKNPTYYQVCERTTGHAEALQITYDPKVISFDELLEVFWKTHDPTTLNRQGNDVGTQYRSAIFYHTDEQKRLAEHYKQKLDAAGLFPGPIVTEIVPFTEFFKAEDYHQNYYAPELESAVLPRRHQAEARQDEASVRREA